MKPVANKSIVSKMREIHQDPDAYWCRHCGAKNSGIAHFSEMGYGSATLVNLDGELDNQETHDYGDFEITEYVCGDCESRARCAEDVFTNENPDGGDEEEEDEEEEEEEDECLCVSHN